MNDHTIHPRSAVARPAFDVDAAINECMDLESGGRPDELRSLIRRATAQDPAFEAKLLKARAMMGQLREVPATPSMAPEILTEVDYLRPFLSPRRRRQLSATRVAIAAAAVITLSFMAVLQKMYPQAAHGPTPDGVVRASGANAADSINSIASAVDDLRMGNSKPAIVGRPHQWNGPAWSEDALVMGDTSRYDSGTNWTTELALGPTRRGALFMPGTMEHGLDLAETGWDHAPITLSLAPMSGLQQRPMSSSITPGADPTAPLLRLNHDLLLGPSWGNALSAGADAAQVRPAPQN